jgi:hypothetical protein
MKKIKKMRLEKVYKVQLKILLKKGTIKKWNSKLKVI